MFGLILVLHVLGATVWTGGHLVLALTVLPRALRERSIAELQRFEVGYERVGIPALVLSVLLAVDARLRLIPRLTPERLGALAWHIVPVTILSVLFVIVGVAFRAGFLY